MKIPSVWLAAAVGAWIGLVPLVSAGEAEPAPVVTRHQIQVGGKTLNYTAEAGRIAIRDVQTGEPHAYMFYTAYRLVSRGKARPVTFLWGGGPGGASAVMDFTLAGPLRADIFVGRGDRLIDNQYTWLTDTDLVFVDEVGTGFSRPTSGAYMKEFNGTIGDTNSFAELIRCWRIQHDAEDTPVFVGGGSWGAPRAATVGYALLKRGIPVHGTVMISGETSLNKPYISPLLFEGLRVVGMAEIGFHYGKLAPELGNDFPHIAAEADAWVRNTYVPALQRVSNLTPPERSRIAAGLARFTGIPAAAIDHQTLQITPKQFREGLLRDESKTLIGVDLRFSEPLEHFKWPLAAQRYLKYQMAYRSDLPYVMGPDDIHQGFAPFGDYPVPAGQDWDFATSPVPPEKAAALARAAEERGAGPPTIGEPLPATEEAIDLNPRMKVLVIIARYDGESTCAANAELQRNLPEKLQRAMIFKCYDSGHTVWRTPGVLSRLKEDVVAMMGVADYATVPE